MRRALVALAASVIAAVGPTVAAASPAEAAVVGCGQVITESTTLGADIGPCANNGIIVGADNVFLDLNGHTIFGTPGSGDGAGVLVQDRHGVTVRRGTVTQFDGGVVILNGGTNTVTQIQAIHNVGASVGHPPAEGTDFGDGILVRGRPTTRSCSTPPKTTARSLGSV